MERLKLKFQDAKNALKTLEEILKEPFSIIVRDAAIQRFEYTFEAIWKFAKEFLKENEGILSNSPKSCFREMFNLNIISEEETVKLLEITDRRNDTSHTYKAGVAELIFDDMEEYLAMFKIVLKRFEEKMIRPK